VEYIGYNDRIKRSSLIGERIEGACAEVTIRHTLAGHGQ
jgi:hypothetical protein